MSDLESLPLPDDDAETAALDEAWTSLAQLLAACQPALDEQSLVSQISGRLERRRRTRRRLSAGLALAAVVLVAVGVRWWAAAPNELAPERPNMPEADFAWHDEIEDDIELTRFDVMLVEAEAHRRVDPLEWVGRDLDELEWEMEVSPL